MRRIKNVEREWRIKIGETSRWNQCRIGSKLYGDVTNVWVHDNDGRVFETCVLVDDDRRKIILEMCINR